MAEHPASDLPRPGKPGGGGLPPQWSGRAGDGRDDQEAPNYATESPPAPDFLPGWAELTRSM